MSLWNKLNTRTLNYVDDVVSVERMGLCYTIFLTYVYENTLFELIRLTGLKLMNVAINPYIKLKLIELAISCWFLRSA